MQNNLSIFNFNNHKIRTLVINNEPYFVLTDVCKILQIGNARQVKSRLTDDVISNDTIFDSLGRLQKTTLVNEDGLYDCIFESRKKEARIFRKWITSEVLPSIRKTGSYSVASNDVNVNNNNEISIKIKDLQQISSSLKLHKQNNENLLNDIERLKLNIAQLNNTISYIKQERTDALVFGKTILATLHEYEEKYNINLIV